MNIKNFLPAMCMVVTTVAALNARAGGSAPISCTTVSKAVVATQPVEAYAKDGHTLIRVGTLQLISEVVDCEFHSQKQEKLYSEVTLDESIPEYDITIKDQWIKAEVFNSLEFDGVSLLSGAKSVDADFRTISKVEFNSPLMPSSTATIDYVQKNTDLLFIGGQVIIQNHLSAVSKSEKSVLMCNLLNHGMIITLKAHISKKAPLITNDLTLYALRKAKNGPMAKPAGCQ